MKKLAAILCLSALATGAFAQGLVGLLNSSTTLISTNSAALGGGSGPTSPTPTAAFWYALFSAPSTVTSVSAADLLGSTWTFTGVYGTNIAATTGGRLSGGNNIATQTGWAAGAKNSYTVVGWSANLGTTWSAVAAQLAGATLAGGEWTGPNWAGNSQGGFFGMSAVGFGTAGGVTASGTLPYYPLFGSGPTAAGTPITTGTTLYVVTVPEPATLALAGLGAAALMIFRRRK